TTIDNFWIRADYDNTTPTWPTDTGINDIADLMDEGKLWVDWDAGTDSESTPVTYNVYVYNSSETFDWNSPNYTGITSTEYTIEGLVNNQEYRVGVRVIDAVGNVDTNTVNLTGTPTPDVTAPWIVDVTAEEVSANMIIVEFETDEPSNAQVEWGIDTNYGNTTIINPDHTLTHEVHVYDLPANTTIHFRILTNDSRNNQELSSDYQFTTNLKHTPVNDDTWWFKFEDDLESAYLWGNITPEILLLMQSGNTSGTPTVTYDIWNVNDNSAITTGATATFNSTTRQYIGTEINVTSYENKYLRITFHVSMNSTTIDEQQTFFVGQYENGRGIPFKIVPLKTSMGPTFNASKDYHYYFKNFNDGSLPDICKGTISVDIWNADGTAMVSGATPTYLDHGVYNYTIIGNTLNNTQDYTIRARCFHSGASTNTYTAYADSMISLEGKNTADINRPSIYMFERDLWFPNAESETIFKVHVLDNLGPSAIDTVSIIWRKNDQEWQTLQMNQESDGIDFADYIKNLSTQHAEDEIDYYFYANDTSGNEVDNFGFGEMRFNVQQRPLTINRGLMYLSRNRYWFGNSTRYSEFPSKFDGTVYPYKGLGDADSKVIEFQEFNTIRSYVMVLDAKGIPFSDLTIKTWLGNENETNLNNVTQYLVKDMIQSKNGQYNAVWYGYPYTNDTWADYEGDTGVSAESQYIWGVFLSREIYYVYVDYNGDNESDINNDFLAYAIGDTIWKMNNQKDPGHCDGTGSCGNEPHDNMYNVNRTGGQAYCTDCHGLGYTEALNRSMLGLDVPGIGPSIDEHLDAGFAHPRGNNTYNGLTEFSTYPTNGCANDRACHGDDSAGIISGLQSTNVPGYPDGTYKITNSYYPNPSQCMACHTYEDNIIPQQKGHNNLLGCKFCHREYHQTQEYTSFDNTTGDGIAGYQVTHEYAKTCYKDCHIEQEKHCELVKCSECHIGFDTPLQHRMARVYDDRYDCGNCHQSKGNITEHDKTIDLNTLVRGIPDPSAMGSNTDGDDWFDNETNDEEWYYFVTGTQACRYCHGRVYNEPDGKGRITDFMGDNTINSTINSTNNWCAGCHVDSYTSGSKTYADMVNIYNTTVGIVPPEITGNNSLYDTGKYYYSTRAGYENHNDSESTAYVNGNYSDAKCFECHGGSYNIMVG
ncbi:MAG: fibronectin type III domain-containing protein, partial [Candidatus Aenigmarchaeota archaeon]|nr:fibronectin type III domain-containing protein [Candidatus Aenigmarchaeota archaeon]